jgi:hypothetical protein
VGDRARNCGLVSAQTGAAGGELGLRFGDTLNRRATGKASDAARKTSASGDQVVSPNRAARALIVRILCILCFICAFYGIADPTKDNDCG